MYKKCADEAAGWQFIKHYVENQTPPVIDLVEAVTGSPPVPIPTVPPAASRRVNFEVPPNVNTLVPTRAPTPVTGVRFGVDISTGEGTHAFGVRTNLGNDMLMKLAPESMTAAQRSRLGEQILDSVAQPGMSATAENDVTEVEDFTDAIVGLTAAAGRLGGAELGGHKDSHWKKGNHVSLKMATDAAILLENMELLQSAEKADLELTLAAITEVYTRSGYSQEVAEQLAENGGIYRVSVDTYSYYIALHIHLVSLALKSGFPAAKLELDYHVKKLLLFRKRLPSRLQVLMANYTYLRDLMKSGWSCLAIELLHRKAIQTSIATFLPASGQNPGMAADGAPPLGLQEPCGWCCTGLHGYNQSVNSCPWKSKSRNQAKTAAREAMRNLARGMAYAPPPPAEGE